MAAEWRREVEEAVEPLLELFESNSNGTTDADTKVLIRLVTLGIKLGLEAARLSAGCGAAVERIDALDPTSILKGPAEAAQEGQS